MFSPKKYRFVSHWHLDAPLDATWEAICDVKTWPEWWRGMIEIKELNAGDDRGIGGIMRHTWKSKLPYRVIYKAELMERTEQVSLKGKVWGDLSGTGIWEFHPGTKGTILTCTWEVRTTRVWMNVLSGILRPIFTHNHRTVMNWGANGLANKLGCTIISKR